jgi:hypothetical protein
MTGYLDRDRAARARNVARGGAYDAPVIRVSTKSGTILRSGQTTAAAVVRAIQSGARASIDFDKDIWQQFSWAKSTERSDLANSLEKRGPVRSDVEKVFQAARAAAREEPRADETLTGEKSGISGLVKGAATAPILAIAALILIAPTLLKSNKKKRKKATT